MMNQILAPIIVFSYNRPEHLRKTLDALSHNDLASESILFVYCDGAKKDADEDQIKLIDNNRQVAKSISGFKDVVIVERAYNWGLANNIIGAVTEVVDKYGKVITLEDDVITSRGFLKYMNDALNIYELDEQVMHISAYMYPHKGHLPDTFFYEVPYPGGGWATWKRAWDHFSNDINELYSYWSRRWKDFNKYGGDYLQVQMEANYNGSLYTWFIKWHAVMLRENGLTLYPHTSLTNNIGFDGTGSNCSMMNKFDIPDPADYIPVYRTEIKENKKASRIIFHFYSGHWYSKRHRKKLFARIKRLFQC